MNFISVIDYREAQSSIPVDSFEHAQTITYFDDLGKPLQVINVGASALGNDIVQPVLYDNLGRENIKSLSYALGERSGKYQSAVTETTVNNYYVSNTPEGIEANNRAYTQIGFENSPLNRVVSQTGPGTAWANKPLLSNYLSNDASVSGWHVNDNGSFTGTTYSAHMLSISEIIDEQGNTTREYKDMQGKVIQKSSLVNAQWYSTHYIYDDLGRLRCVVPPKATGPEDWNYAFTISMTQRKG